MSTIKAKLHCGTVTTTNGNTEHVKLEAVVNNSPTNKEWSQWTPSASLEMQINNPAALGIIQSGKSYIIEIREAQDDE